MRIALIRTGGIIPVTKKAETEVDWSDEEMTELMEAVKNEGDPGGQRDATAYLLQNNAGTFPVNMETVPAKYKKTLEELKDNLRIVKPRQH